MLKQKIEVSQDSGKTVIDWRLDLASAIVLSELIKQDALLKLRVPRDGADDHIDFCIHGNDSILNIRLDRELQ
jgi:hypothetical protein